MVFIGIVFSYGEVNIFVDGGRQYEVIVVVGMFINDIDVAVVLYQQRL